MDKNDIYFETTVIDSLTVIIDSLAFIDMSLKKLIADKKKENFFSASELAGLSYCLHYIIDRTDDCYSSHLSENRSSKQQVEQEGTTVLNEEAKSLPPNPNPIIRNTLQGTLAQISDTMYFIVSMLDRFKHKGKKKLLLSMEVSGLRNLIKGIKGAAEHCLTLCSVS